MKKLYTLLVWILLYGYSISYAQSPYSISPDWYFGINGRLQFPTGSYPTSGAPTVLSNAMNILGVEASTSVCFRNNNIALYTNTKHAYNGNPANAAWTDFIRNFSEFGDNVCSGSATGGGVSFPDPQSNATNDAFYVILANDLTGGTCGSKGLNRYRFQVQLVPL